MCDEEFKTLVKKAEEYIEKNASKILIAAREVNGKECKLASDNCTVEKLLEDYKPKFNDVSEITYEAILEHFCHELQNYQGMPRAINYASYTNGKENEIVKFLIEYGEDISKDNLKDKPKDKFADQYINFYKELQKKLKFEENKEIGEKGFNDNKYNFAWYKYSRGLLDVLIEAKYSDSFVKKIQNSCQCINGENYENPTYNLKTFSSIFTGIGETMARDFFKELYCVNLIKDDIHIKECYKSCILENPEDDFKSKDMIEYFIKKSPKLVRKTPYYVDKILWLCCTGNFYKDNIIITTMNRKDFIDFVNEAGKYKKG